ncbi:MAG: transglutaminase-like domain-containing protein [Planctomycetota bacterium]
MHDSFACQSPDPREMPGCEGELFRRRVRATALLDLAENVGAERRAEISREIIALGEAALPALHRAVASRRENAAALSRGLIRILLPDEIGREIHAGLAREKKNYRVEHGAVQLSRLCYPNIPVQRVLRDIDELASRATDYISTALSITQKEVKRAANRDTIEVVKSLGSFWREEGFQGRSDNFYTEKNSYMSDVIERRTGLPITLSVLYLAIARRVHLNAEGVGLPGHFIVRVAIAGGEGEHFTLIDPFNGAHSIDLGDCRERVESMGQPFLPEEHLRPVTPREILGRMCNNLLALFNHQKKSLESERVATVLAHLQPGDPIPPLLRGERRLRRGDRKGARADFERARTLDPHGPIGRTAAEMIERMSYENPFA